MRWEFRAVFSTLAWITPAVHTFREAYPGLLEEEMAVIACEALGQRGVFMLLRWGRCIAAIPKFLPRSSTCQFLCPLPVAGHVAGRLYPALSLAPLSPKQIHSKSQCSAARRIARHTIDTHSPNARDPHPDRPKTGPPRLLQPRSHNPPLIIDGAG